MPPKIRVRFAPSPTGHVHIGNVRVAVFNWLFARHEGGRFLLRVEDTDRERSTPEAVATLLEAMAWLGLDYDEPPVYQSAECPRHAQAAHRLLNLERAYRNSDPAPAVVFKVQGELFDPSFVTDPGEEAVLDARRAARVRATLRSLVLIDRNEKTGEEHLRPIPWDALEAGLRFVLENGASLAGEAVRAAVRERCGENVSDEASCDLAEALSARVAQIAFRRRTVFFEDLILGRMEKPLESLSDFVVARGDGTPVFHLANVVDDVTMAVTHILRGNDHVENTFRHLFLFRALGAKPPVYGHFPMIVNPQGRPYSKRDGDAYVGDFAAQGFLPEALFNFLALCGWNPGDEREKMARSELVRAFSLDRVSRASAQFDREKLLWLNGQYIAALPEEELFLLCQEALGRSGVDAVALDETWLGRLAAIHRERIHTLSEFVEKTRYFFSDRVAIDLSDKAIRKVLHKPEARGVLEEIRPALAALPAWSEEALDRAIREFAEARGLSLGAVAQPLRVAATGGTASPGIHETLFLVGRDRTLARIDDALRAMAGAKQDRADSGS
ncbi:MAG: glutamate--tRNA ligase family protein [Planctomycetota bacterium]